VTVQLLFIDDDPALGRLIQKRLGRAACTVALARDSAAGLARIREGGVDVVALDHHMPGQDGLEALAEIMRLENPPPVIYVTGTNDSRIAVAALKAGAVDYLVKDLQGEFMELLEVAIGVAVAGAKLRRERDAAHQEMKAARDRFEALAAERQMLLREVNHRVGNSLQLVAAFLHFQSASADPATRSALSEATRRVQAVAQVHRRLYGSDDVQSVALATYLQGLVDDIRAATDSGGGAELTLSAEDVSIDPDSAVAVGVIVTELVINALKYAYPGGSGPSRVLLRQTSPDVLKLSVEDDGLGMPIAMREGRTGIGHTIIETMATKLNARMEYLPGQPGTRANLIFPHAAVRPAEA
jgi:two-component sensor histidine kinase